MAERGSGGPTVARWESWDSTGLQHLVLRVGPEEIVAVPSAPGAASVRVWQVMSRGRDPSTVTGPKPGAPAAGGRSCCLSSDAARAPRIVDRGLNGAPVPLCAAIAHADRRRGPCRARRHEEQRRGEDPGAREEASPRFSHPR